MEPKVKVTLHLTQKALALMLEGEYATQRTMGEFISGLIVEHCSTQQRQLTPAEIAVELRRLADMLEGSA